MLFTIMGWLVDRSRDAPPVEGGREFSSPVVPGATVSNVSSSVTKKIELLTSGHLRNRPGMEQVDLSHTA